jgi:DNA-directed RNA polymerase specialized sigma24 family protein
MPPTDDDAPQPPKELATLAEKDKLFRDPTFLGELKGCIKRHVLHDQEEDVLQETLEAITFAAVPRAPDELVPYCKKIAANTAGKYAKNRLKKVDARAVSLDPAVHDPLVAHDTRTPEDIVRHRQGLRGVLARTWHWGMERQWVRLDLDGVPDAEIAQRSGVAKKTVQNAVSKRRGELRKMAEQFLIFLMGLIGLPVLIKNILYRGSAVGSGRTGFAEVESALPFLVIALTAVGLFVLVARVGRPRRRVVFAALAASSLFAAHSASIGADLDGQYWGTFPDRLTGLETFIMYGSEALAFIGAGGLLASLAARRFGWKGFLPVLIVSPIVALFVNAVLAEAFQWPWVSVTAQDALVMWAERTAIMYAILWWIGREPKPLSAAVEAEPQPPVAATDAASPDATATGSAASSEAEEARKDDDEDRSAAE